MLVAILLVIASCSFFDRVKHHSPEGLWDGRGISVLRRATLGNLENASSSFLFTRISEMRNEIPKVILLL